MSNDLSQNAPSADDRNLAMLAHILGIFTSFIAPLIIWLMNKDRPGKAFVNDQAKEALNFQITVLPIFVIGSILMKILASIGFLLILLGALFSLLGIGVIALCIIAGIAASKGTKYRYFFALRLIK
ncbi:MAG: DUF4870 domain-containing protein [Zoogloeaceae bacterium]|jgi:uncharacterized Tic20 family protein|nr:DUF4870 domain-containing protein [Zoogloeaceae bacterium]